MMIKRRFTSLCYNNIKQIAPSFANNVVHTLFPVKSNTQYHITIVIAMIQTSTLSLIYD